MIATLKNKQFWHIEQSVSELADCYSRPMHEANTEHWNQAKISSRPKGYFDREWFGGIKHENEAIEMLNSGWSKGADKLKALSREAIKDIPAAHSRKRKLRWADDGDSLDVDRALAGEWDTAYRVAYRKWSSGPTTIELITSWGGNCGRTAEEMFWTGACGVVLADILEQAGYSVRLTGASLIGVYSSDQLTLKSVVVKEAGEPLRIDAVAGVLCHAGVYRTLGFHTIMTSPWNVGAGLGSCQSWSSRAEQVRKAGLHPEQTNSLLLNHAYTKEAAVAEIRKVVAMIQDKHAKESAA